MLYRFCELQVEFLTELMLPAGGELNMFDMALFSCITTTNRKWTCIKKSHYLGGAAIAVGLLVAFSITEPFYSTASLTCCGVEAMVCGSIGDQQPKSI